MPLVRVACALATAWVWLVSCAMPTSDRDDYRAERLAHLIDGVDDRRAEGIGAGRIAAESVARLTLGMPSDLAVALRFVRTRLFHGMSHARDSGVYTRLLAVIAVVLAICWAGYAEWGRALWPNRGSNHPVLWVLIFMIAINFWMTGFRWLRRATPGDRDFYTIAGSTGLALLGYGVFRLILQ